jgi:hypothetical protein
MYSGTAALVPRARGPRGRCVPAIRFRLRLRRNPIFADIFSVLTRGADPTTSLTSSSVVLLGLHNTLPAPFLQTKIIVMLAIHLPTDSYPRHNLHATESLEGLQRRTSPVCISPSSRPAFSLRALILISVLLLTLLQPCPLALPPCPSAFTDLDAASAPTIHICTDFVQSPRRRVPPNPPVPSSTMPLATADRISGALCGPLAPTCLGCAHR